MTPQEIIHALTLAEKAALLQGDAVWTTREISRVSLPAMWMADGPHGLRKAKRRNKLSVTGAKKATCFPTASAMACSWDPELGEELGRALGAEAAAQGVHMLLGPGLNHKRSPLGGRNFEYFSEDPYLSGKMAAGYVRGIQSRGVAACVKHFAVNSQELRRMKVDSVVDERTLREIYLAGFAIAVKEGHPKGIMASYNPVNGVYATENPFLLQTILRREWGFSGAVISDWGACHDPVAAIRAGLALNMPAPGADNALRILAAVKDGRLSEADIDSRLRELLPVIMATAGRKKPSAPDKNAHHALAQTCALRSAVLLENDGILPLAPGTRVALIGELAQKPRYQGAGSSQVRPWRLDTLADSLSTMLPVTYARGYRKGSPFPDGRLIAEAVTAAKTAQTAVICIGLEENTECESRERQTMVLPRSQLRLVEAVCSVNRSVVLVLSGGSPFRVPRHRSIRGILLGGLGGQAGGSAMAKLLTGRENPCGHLAETWPEDISHTPCHGRYPAQGLAAQYREGLFTGYRYYESAGVPVRWPFGHGRSYTDFTYTDPEANAKEFRFTLTNTGAFAGAQVAQVYVTCRGGKVLRPKKVLAGFCRVFLKPGESRRVSIPLGENAFRYYDTAAGKWDTETAHYILTLGESVADEKLKVTLRLLGNDTPHTPGELPHYEAADVGNVTREEFAALLGRPPVMPKAGDSLTVEDTLGRLAEARSPAARWLGRLIVRKAEQTGETPDMTWTAIRDLPLCRLSQMTRGHITAAMTEDLLYWADGHFLSGLKRLAVHYIEGRKAAARWEELLEE